VGIGGHTPEKMAQARLQWGTHINDSGLLKTLESGFEFKAFSDARVPEHAPFYVYEILKVDLGK
jgi:hypothetical protein